MDRPRNDSLKGGFSSFDLCFLGSMNAQAEWCCLLHLARRDSEDTDGGKWSRSYVSAGADL